jgi:hypothetical protein
MSRKITIAAALLLTAAAMWASSVCNLVYLGGQYYCLDDRQTAKYLAKGATIVGTCVNQHGK